MRCTRLLLPALVLASACTDKAPAIAPPLGDGKSDVSDRVDIIGPLALESEVREQFDEDLEFHGYTLDVRAGAEVDLDITHAGSSAKLDTSIYVYGPASDAGSYGTDAIAFDDDSGWGRLSRLRGLELTDGGRYLVVIGTHDGRGRGRYRLTAACASGDCAPAGLCHPVIAADIRACADDLLADPDSEVFDELEAIHLCSDAEPAADAHDQVCAEAAPPAFCELSYEEFALQYLPMCDHQLTGEVLDHTCSFGASYRDMVRSATKHILARRKITSPDGLSALERDQVVLAVQASSNDDVTTVEEALERVDEGEINQLSVWDSTNRRRFDVYEYGAGDNSYGRLFAGGTTDIVADIGDGEMRDCTVMFGPEGRRCRSDDECAGAPGGADSSGATIECVGIAAETGRGLCVDLAADNDPAEGSACSEADLCPADAGLVCAGISRGPEGLCLPAWTQRRFVSHPELDIPDGSPAGATSMLIAEGLATVDTDVWLQAMIFHPAIDQLRVTLTNPAGAEVVIFDGDTTGPELILDIPVEGFTGDEEVVGAWTLHVVDSVSGSSGMIWEWGLVVGSRFD